MRIVSSLVFLLLCGTMDTLAQNHRSVPSEAAPLGPGANEDITLLNFILPRQFGLAKPGFRGFVVQRETIPLKEIKDRLSYPMHRRRHPQKENREAFDGFARRNTATGKTPSLAPGISLITAARNEIQKAFKQGGWKNFYKKYPHTNGLLRLSLPGYSSNHLTALVYIERSSGGLSGLGEMLLLVKKDGKWSVKEILTGWES